MTLSLNSASASISTERILSQIDRINDKVDRFIFDMVDLDRNLNNGFANKSKELEVCKAEWRTKYILKHLHRRNNSLKRVEIK